MSSEAQLYEENVDIVIGEVIVLSFVAVSIERCDVGVVAYVCVTASCSNVD